METKTSPKESSFLRRGAPDKIKDSAFVPQKHQVRMRFTDERDKGIYRSAHSRGDGGLVESLQLE